MPSLVVESAEAALLVDEVPEMTLHALHPAAFPYISYDDQGVCNYCQNYVRRNQPKPIESCRRFWNPIGVVTGMIASSRSPGRDSCYTLHLAVQELNLRPITYTYDWAMVTDR